MLFLVLTLEGWACLSYFCLIGTLQMEFLATALAWRFLEGVPSLWSPPPSTFLIRSFSRMWQDGLFHFSDLCFEVIVKKNKSILSAMDWKLSVTLPQQSHTLCNKVLVLSTFFHCGFVSWWTTSGKSTWFKFFICSYIRKLGVNAIKTLTCL